MSLEDVAIHLAESDEHENRILRKHLKITDLRTVAPERYVEVHPKDGGEFDWLEQQITWP